jgi:hypothetical protein
LAADCDRPAKVRGYCRPDYYRLKKLGLLTNLPVKPPVRERFEEMVQETPGGCWEWQGARNDLGYGQLALAGHKRVYAHRFSYEKFVGPIPAGLQLDHLCRNPPCVNPTHLEPVTQRENLLRADSEDMQAYWAGVCRRGHPRAGDNVILSSSRPGKRDCRPCARIREQNRKKRTRQRRKTGKTD